MKTLKRITAACLILALLLSLCACGGTDTAENPISLTDQAGRTVVLEKEAERVVSCYYVTTYAMLSLGLGDALVGIEKKADTRPIYAMADPALPELPAVGSLKEIDTEKIAALEPDLVILPKKLQDSAATLEALGIPALIVNPETNAALAEMLTLLGKACGASEQADKLLAYREKKLGDFTPEGEAPSVLFCGNSSYLTAAPADMYQSDLISLSGGTNAFADTEGSYWTEISYETILALDPDYIVIPAGADYTAADILGDSALSSLRAVQENRVFTMPNTFEEWDSPIPSGVLGVLWLRSVLHPADYTTDSFRKDTADFYETFYGFTPDAAALETLG